MSQTDYSRRGSLRVALAGIAVSILMPQIAQAATSEADADLIACCTALQQVGAAHTALFAINPGTIEGENAQLPEIGRLGDEEARLVDVITCLCPPRTLAGARALAAAAMAIAEHDREGELVIDGRDFPEVLALLLARTMTSGRIST